MIDNRFFIDMGATIGGDLTTKDSLLIIRNKLIAEIGELRGLRRTEADALKTFISKDHDEYRPPYGSNPIKIPRTVSFIGSTNEGEYLQDTTGARRFFPIMIERIDFSLFKRMDIIRNLYSFYYRWAQKLLTGTEEEIKDKAFEINIQSPALIKYLEEIRAEKRVQSPYENLIQDYIEVILNKNYLVIGRADERKHIPYFNAGECAMHIFKVPGSIPRDFNKYFAACMRERGFLNKNTRIAGKVLKHWITGVKDNFQSVTPVTPVTPNS